MYHYPNRGVSKAISVLTIVTFLLTNTAYGASNSRSFFKNKKVDYKKLSTQREERLQDKKSVLQNEDAAKKEQHKRQAKRVLSSHLGDLSQIHIPSELGRVTDVYQAPKDDSRLIVHIQDLHTNPEAQLNLASILELLLKDYKLGLVCSEGADGEVDTSSVSSFPNYKAREKTAQIFIDSGELTGEEYLSITKYPKLPIWGIEDRDIYFKNIIEFNRIMKFSPQSQVFVSQVKPALEQLMPKIYSRELLNLEQKEVDYENEKIETDEYLKYISSYIQRFNIPTSDYKNITLLSESMAQEKDIDQVKIMQESQNLLLNLQVALSSKSDRKSMDALVVKAQLFKEQKISPFSFYSYLKDLALRHIPEEIAKYPNLNEFIDYLIKVNSLDTTKLFVEMEALTYEVKQRIARTEEQKTLINVLRNIKFLEGFFNLKVSNEELDYYLENRESHKVGFFESFLKPALKKYNISLFIDYNPALIDFHLQGLEDFYKTVKARDVAMVRNSVSEIEKRNVKVATLIAGGFHTKGITRLLREKGYSYIVVSPYSSTDIDEENYHFLLSGRRKPITQLMEQLDLPEIINRLTSGLRITLGFDEDLKAAWNEVVVPEIAKIWGMNEEDLISGSIWKRIGPVLALQKGAEKWEKTIVYAMVIARHKEKNEVIVQFRPRYFPKKAEDGRWQENYHVRITPKSVSVLDELNKELASISKEKITANTSLTSNQKFEVKSQPIKINGLEVVLGSLIGLPENIYVSNFKNRVILKNSSGQELEVEVKSHKGKQYALIGNSVYLVKKGKIDLSKINPMGNDDWFNFFGLPHEEIDVKDCRVYLPVSEKDVVLFPANKILHPSLLPNKSGNPLARRILERYRDGDISLQSVLHLTASVAMNGIPDDYYLAQDVLNRVQGMDEHKQYKEVIASVSDYLYLSYRGIDWNKWDKKIAQIKIESKKKVAGEKKRSLTLYERDVEPTRLAVPDLENWEVAGVEALEEKDLSFISEDKSNPVVLLGKQAIEKGEIVSVPFMGGSATTVKREIGQHKMVHKALKVRIKKAGRLVTGWISIAQARLGLIFGQNTNSKVVVVTSVDGTKEGESDKSVRDLLDTEYSEARNSGQINVSVQKAGLVLDTKTGLPLMFKDRHIATCAENHLWAFLSILMDKALVIDLLENSSGILSAGNGDNILNYPRASMVGEILKARKDGESIATVAMCSPSKGDKKGGFAARVTYRNKETGEEITQIEFREVSEFATRKKGDKAKKIPGTGYEAIDFFGEEDTDIFKRLDKEKQFIEDIFGDRSVAFNVAFYAVDLRLFIARIFGFDETKSDLIARLKGVDSQYWVDRIIELSEKVPETIQPEKKVPNEDNTDNVKGYITEQAVQDFIVNSMGLLAKDGISPAVDIKLGDRKDTFLPYKGKKQSVLREDGSEVMGDDGRPREDYDLIANIAVYKSAIGSLKEKGHPLVLGEGAHVAEVLSTTKDEIIKVNIASGHKLGTSDKQQLKIYVIPADKLERNPVPFNNWLDRQNKATTKVIIIARDRDEFDKQLVNYKNKYKDTGKVLLKIIEKPGVDISSMEEEFILRGVVPEDLTYAIGVFGKDAFFGGFELKVLNTDKDKALFKAIGEGV